MKKTLRNLLHLGVFFFASAGILPGQSMVVVEASKDNTIFSEDGSLSNGSGQYLFSGATNNLAKRRALLKFDLAGQIPAGVQIDSVHLKLKLNKGPLIDPLKFYLHRLNDAWGEAGSDASAEEGRGTAADMGDATWSHRHYDHEAWDTPGGDFQVNPSDSTLISGNSGPVTWRGAGLATDVQGWLENDTSNHGWMLTGNETLRKSAKRFVSREHPVEADRPELTVYYSTLTRNAADRPSPGHDLRIFPNPFLDELNIVYRLDQQERSQLAVYNLLGQRLKTIMNGVQSPGSYRFTWNGRDRTGKTVAPGIYYVVLVQGNDRKVHKIMKSR